MSLTRVCNLQFEKEENESLYEVKTWMMMEAHSTEIYRIVWGILRVQAAVLSS